METKQPNQEVTIEGPKRFFMLVYHMLMYQDDVLKLAYAISGETNDVRKKRLEEAKLNSISRAKAMEQLIRSEIDAVDDYYTKNKLFKFWKNEQLHN